VHPLPGCSYTFSAPASVTVLYQTDTTVQVQFKSAGTYTLSLAFPANCSSAKDSVQVVVNPLIDQLFLGKDTTLCSGTSITVNAGNGFMAYKWQPLQFMTILDSIDVKIYPKLNITFTMSALEFIG